MVMENPFEGKEIWFGVGSQDLYGEEALRQVAIHSAEMVDYLNNTGKIPAKIVLKPTLKSSDGVKEFMVEASRAGGVSADLMCVSARRGRRRRTKVRRAFRNAADTPSNQC